MPPEAAMQILQQAGITPETVQALAQPEVQQALMTMAQAQGGGGGMPPGGPPPGGMPPGAM
jgi:hypothetical protein